MCVCVCVLTSKRGKDVDSMISSIRYSYNSEYAECINDDKYDKSVELNSMNKNTLVLLIK